LCFGVHDDLKIVAMQAPTLVTYWHMGEEMRTTQPVSAPSEDFPVRVAISTLIRAHFDGYASQVWDTLVRKPVMQPFQQSQGSMCTCNLIAQSPMHWRHCIF
jgi:hypothetical protein